MPRAKDSRCRSSARLALPFLPLVLLLGLTSSGLAQDSGKPRVYRGADTSELVVPYVFEGDLRQLPKAAEWRPGDPIKEIPRRTYPRPGAQNQAPPPPRVDPLLEVQARAQAGQTRAFTAPLFNFLGQGYTGVNPPDTVGDVGPNYYIQMINGSSGALYTIYNKTTGALVAGPTALETLGSGFCASGLGDPVVLYDEAADRWLLSEFSNSGNRLCVYVSRTSNPVTGGFFAYEFAAPTFPDYPKYAVWSDAYYVTTNESTPAVYALERSKMLAGLPATAQRKAVPDLAGFGFQALTPGDIDGATLPPAGSPHYVMRHRDDESHNAGSNDVTRDFLEVWEFRVDFTTPANTTLTGPLNIAVAEFDSNLCGLTSFNCVPQPSTTVRLDPLREVIMFRLQYRNFGSYETLVGNLVTDVNGTDRHGVRWFELRKSGPASWSLFQEGTYSPDATNRWMGASAMDGSGNLAVGYNAASSSVFPGLRYAGRLATDPAGTLPQGETTLISGTASNGSNRYGDYAALSVDPDDDCTFWFTGEYNTASTWSTRIGAFKFDGCGSAQTCGNNVREGSEVCDGTDLGGSTCASQGCSGGGTLACNATCTAFVTSGCSGCPVCDNDGICESGEDCSGCPNDCVSGSTSGAVCGNGLCETANSEDCVTCPADCNGQQGGRPANRFCCGNGGSNPVGCSDSRCISGGFSCTTTPSIPGSFCCGDGFCDAGESCSNCGLDCATGAEICNDTTDNDCNGFTDCADPTCVGSPACPTCGGAGTACTAGSQCCSGVCKSNGRCR